MPTAASPSAQPAIVKIRRVVDALIILMLILIPILIIILLPSAAATPPTPTPSTIAARLLYALAALPTTTTR